jgi:hypothetical protein
MPRSGRPGKGRRGRGQAPDAQILGCVRGANALMGVLASRFARFVVCDSGAAARQAMASRHRSDR